MGIHGQTVLHRPAERFTLQLFDADRFNRGWIQSEVVTNFRAADMKAGGQGAPLAPFFHFALARRAGLSEPVAFLNLGGVGNVTWIDPAAEAPEAPGALLAFDTGPANALIDDFMAARTGQGFDADGAAAARGTVRRDVLDALPEFPYLSRKPPKSLDRNDFLPVLDAVAGLSTEDGAATLTAFTADCVAAGVRHMPSPPTRWLVCGGGRRNLTLMKMLAERLAAPVDPVEAVGLDGDMLEAQAFAYLAVRVLRGLPTSAPSTTGCRAPVCGGRISYP
jgi:anhydro-N-acetylmuramic acid kinase